MERVLERNRLHGVFPAAQRTGRAGGARRHDSGGRRRRPATRSRGCTPTTCGWCTRSSWGGCRAATSTTWCRTSSSRRTRESASCATRPRSAAGWRRSRATGRPTTFGSPATRSNCRTTCQAAIRSKPKRSPSSRSSARLPDAYRETLLMRLVEGMSGSRDRRAHGADARVGAREPAPRDEDAARETGVDTAMNDDYSVGRLGHAGPRREAARATARPSADDAAIRRARQVRPVAGRPHAERQPTYSIRFLVPALAAAAAIVMMVGLTWQAHAQRRIVGGRAASTVSRASARSPLSGTGRLAVGQTLSTDHRRGRAESRHDWPGDRRHRHTRAAGRDARRRIISSRSNAAPCTRSSSRRPASSSSTRRRRRAIDLGCVYDLFVDEDGSGLLTVAPAGWHSNEGPRVVRAGRRFVTHRSDARSRHAALRRCEPAFRDALDEFDYGPTRATGRSAAVRPRPRAAARCDDALAPDLARQRRRSRGRRRRPRRHRGDARGGDARRRPAAGPGCTGSVVGRARARGTGWWRMWKTTVP